jgi:transposase-like protein
MARKATIEKLELKARAWELLRAGYSIREVAKKLTTVSSPISTLQIIKWRDETLQEIAESSRLDAEQYRKLELERLDKVGINLNNAMTQLVENFIDKPISTSEDTEPITAMSLQLKAMQILSIVADKQIKVSMERAKLLGLNSPVKTETVATIKDDGTKVDFKSMNDEQLMLFFADQFQ